MQVQKENQIATLPFIKGQIPASVVTDGKQVRTYTLTECRSFNSLWWAVESLVSLGFHFNQDNFKPFAAASFAVIAAPEGWSTKKVGATVYGFLGGIAKVAGPTIWECQLACIRETLKYCK